MESRRSDRLRLPPMLIQAVRFATGVWRWRTLRTSITLSRNKLSSIQRRTVLMSLVWNSHRLHHTSFHTPSMLTCCVSVQLTAKTKRLIAGAMALVTTVPDSHNSTARKHFAEVMCAKMDNPDSDVDAVCAGALMTTTPWHYYQGSPSGGHFPLMPQLEAAKERLLRATQGTTPNIFAAHLLIHLLEPTNAPLEYRWMALEPTKRLYEYLPGQGHLSHMPAHLFLRVGLYYIGAVTSLKSTEDNRQYISTCLSPYAYGHNVKMLIACARCSPRSHINH